VKKVFSLVLLSFIVFSCIIACSACDKGKDESVYEMYVNALKTLNDSDSTLLKGEVNAVMGGEENLANLKIGMTIAKVMRSDNDCDIKMEMLLEMTEYPDIEVPITMYFKDGISYTETMGQKTKTAMSAEEAMSQANIGLVDFSEEAVKDESFKKANDGKELLITIDGNIMGEVMEQSLGGVSGIFTLGNGVEMSFQDIIITTVVDKNSEFRLINMSFDTEMSNGDETMNCAFSVMMEVVQKGGVTIEFPDDLDVYKESAETGM